VPPLALIEGVDTIDAMHFFRSAAAFGSIPPPTARVAQATVATR